MAKIRLDDLLVKKGIAQDREDAFPLILSGQIRVDEAVVTTPWLKIPEEASVRLDMSSGRYASRGGLKLEGALRDFSIDPSGLVCADLGCSTGGFTDCLLQHGARRVYAIDVGKGLLDWKLRKDRSVLVMEGFNVRNLRPESFEEQPDLFTVDLSFISLRRILPVLLPFWGTTILALVKPQFEAERYEVERGGVIRSDVLREEIVDRVRKAALSLGMRVRGVAPSALPGSSGNQEFFLWLEIPIS